jgi:hypothetical protein
VKLSSRLFLYLAAFDIAAAILYVSLDGEPAGLTMLILAAGLHGIIGGYLFILARRYAAAPEDRADADISEGAGVVGFFSAGSVWPFAIGLTAAICAVGAIYTTLTALAGGVLLVGAALGLATEYWRRP